MRPSLPIGAGQTRPVPEVLEVELTRPSRDARRPTGARRRADRPAHRRAGVDAAVPGGASTGSTGAASCWSCTPTGPTLGMHFGMTGRLLRDGDAAAIDRLGVRRSQRRRALGPLGRPPRRRRRGCASTTPGGSGAIWLRPDLDRLGPDALTLTPAPAGGRARRAPRAAEGGAARPGGRRRARQHARRRGAVVGRARSAAPAPRRSTADEVAALQRAIRRRLPVMLRRGGSHTGTLSPAVRGAGGRCPRDGAPCARDVVGGRTTIWCPSHQR